jgi:hypothetical protein
VIQTLNLRFYPVREPIKTIGKPEDHITSQIRNFFHGFCCRIRQIPAIVTAVCGFYAITSFAASPGTGKSSYTFTAIVTCLRANPGPVQFVGW